MMVYEAVRLLIFFKVCIGNTVGIGKDVSGQLTNVNITK